MRPLIINYREGIYNLNSELMKSTADADDADIQLEVTGIIRLKPDFEALGFQLTFGYFIGEAELLRFGFIITMAIPGWIPLTTNDKIDKSSKEAENKSIREIIFSRAPEQIRSLCRAAIDFARGALSAKLTDTTETPIEIPDFSISDFINTINFRIS
ncbi:MAG: hypothetical protein K2L14_01100 [Duncaniella sp.]|nr:hypothetical protein [Duncaniella sp.]